MDIQFYGGNCVVLTIQGTRIVIDDNLAELGAKLISKNGDVNLYTQAHSTNNPNAKLTIDIPGEYEVASISIYGIPARLHTESDPKKLSGTMYKVVSGEVSTLITGHIFPELEDKVLEQIGMISALVIPVGGNGYTLDPVGALEVTKAIEPKVVIPTHYDDSTLQFPVPQQTLAQALNTLAMEPAVTTTKFKLKNSDLTDNLQLVVVERS